MLTGTPFWTCANLWWERQVTLRGFQGWFSACSIVEGWTPCNHVSVSRGLAVSMLPGANAFIAWLDQPFVFRYSTPHLFRGTTGWLRNANAAESVHSTLLSLRGEWCSWSSKSCLQYASFFYWCGSFLRPHTVEKSIEELKSRNVCSQNRGRQRIFVCSFLFANHHRFRLRFAEELHECRGLRTRNAR